jgi:hypothetical protein
MANYKKQLKDGDGNNIYPAQGLGTITGDNLDYGTLVKTGTWTNTTSLPSTASSAYTVIDVSSLGFSSADDYIVVATNMGGANNDPFLAITIPSTNKTATSFTLMIWNAHWASGAIGSGTKIQWAVFRLN